MQFLSTYQASSGSVHVECTSSTAPLPDAQTGTCLKSPLSGLDAACVNPCTRLKNGLLAVNKNSNQCRVFPGTTDGGIAGGVVSDSNQCTTTCPDTCVELWETCPPGTAPLSSLIQTKSPYDVLALSGPLRADGSPNPLWPKNYSSSFTTNNILRDAIGGKPYTECYSFNTDICEMPMAHMETTPAKPGEDKIPAVPAKTSCYAPCPAGTFQDPNNKRLCLFKPTDNTQYDPVRQAQDPKNVLNYLPTTPVQRVFCNPQFFNPAYWDDKYEGDFIFPGYTGTQKGCLSIELPTKQGSTCGVGLLPIINDNFNLEWCMPECPLGYFNDLSQSTCIATCQGSSGTSGSSNLIIPGSIKGFNPFLDYVDFYATTNRCAASEFDSSTEDDCAQNFVHGRCPAMQKVPVNSKDLVFSETTNTQDILINHKSVNTQCPIKQLKDFNNGANNGYTTAKFDAKAAKLADIRKYQTSYPTGPHKTSRFFGADSYATCPAGMVQGDADCNENNNVCYDICAHGYEPATTCKTGSSTCAPEDTVFICRAKCPDLTEGLGPWKEKTEGQIFACEYLYPQEKVPSDPSLWVQCPDDGRFSVIQSSPTDVSIFPEGRNAPLCLRKTYLRQSACFQSMNPQPDKVTGQITCVAACNANDIIVELPDGTIVCQTLPLQTDKLQLDYVAVADSHRAKNPFKHRVMTRLNLVRGLGSDPNVGIADPTVSKEPQWATFLKWGLLGFAVLFALSFFLPKRKS